MVLVAAHALETPRLMLLSDVGNSSGMVGRNLMDHNAFSLAMIADEPMWSGRGPVQQGDVLKWRDGDFRSRHGCIRHEVGNFVGNVQITERLISQGIIGPELDAKIRHMAARWVFMDSNIEMLPEPTNRMSLSATKRDFYGLPLMDIHYDVNDYARAAGAVIKEDYANFLRLLGGEIFDQNLTIWENRDHPMGTVIMGSDPRDSVVTHEGRSHDHDNLFIATTGLMPAASVVNPTLTGCALSLRSAAIMLKEI